MTEMFEDTLLSVTFLALDGERRCRCCWVAVAAAAASLFFILPALPRRPPLPTSVPCPSSPLPPCRRGVGRLAGRRAPGQEPRPSARRRAALCAPSAGGSHGGLPLLHQPVAARHWRSAPRQRVCPARKPAAAGACTWAAPHGALHACPVASSPRLRVTCCLRHGVLTCSPRLPLHNALSAAAPRPSQLRLPRRRLSEFRPPGLLLHRPAGGRQRAPRALAVSVLMIDWLRWIQCASPPSPGCMPAC